VGQVDFISRGRSVRIGLMSGHSKWSTIKRKKEALDQKKGSVFTKLAKGISVAVKKGGGGDPEMNFALRLAVEKARAANMPKDNIQRAIDRGLGKGGGAEYEEIVLEGYGPGGIAVIVEAVTDNRNRTVSELKNMFEKQGGRLAEPGSVLYQFDRKGYVAFEGELKDEVFLAAVDVGAEDLVEEDGGSYLISDAGRVQEVSRTLEQAGMKGILAGVMYQPKIPLAPEDPNKAAMFLEVLGEHDDIQEVYANLAVSS